MFLYENTCLLQKLSSSLKISKLPQHQWNWVKSSVIRQKGESQDRCFKKIKHAKFSENTYVCVSGGKKMFVFRKIWRALFSSNTFWDLPFCLPTEEMITLMQRRRLVCRWWIKWTKPLTNFWICRCAPVCCSNIMQLNWTSLFCQDWKARNK